MPKTIKEKRLRQVLPIVNKELKLKDVAKLCLCDQKTFYDKNKFKNLEDLEWEIRAWNEIYKSGALCLKWENTG